MTSRNLTPEERAIAARIASAHPLERPRRVPRVQRTGPVRMLGADARLAANEEPDWDRPTPPDTPDLRDRNCDDAGTGEGQWHGRM
jgi:hypothetical protein